MQRKLSPGQWSIAVVMLLTAVLALTPVLDQRAADNYESLFQRALITFALARTLNGVISAVQGTELALQPAGVGVTLTPGQILDPVNDLVERFSWIMLGATVSLGIQQVLLDVSAWWLLQGLVAVLAIWWLLLFLSSREDQDSHKRILMRAFLVVVFLRFAVPLTMIANDMLYQIFLEPRYETSTQVISDAGQDIKVLSERESAPRPEGEEEYFFSSILGSMSDTLSRTASGLDLSGRVDEIQQRATEMIEHLIQLSVVFILQTGILPIAFLWVFLQIAKRLFRPFKS